MSQQLKGLTQAQVQESRERHGRNVLTPPKRKSLWVLFFEKFSDPVIRILLIAAFLLGLSTMNLPKQSVFSVPFFWLRELPFGSNTMPCANSTC